MQSSNNAVIKYRCLLTDTLPYEVPVIFSNDKFHAALARKSVDAISEHLSRLFEYKSAYTIPYNYDISKGEGRRTTLSIIHPLWQKKVAEFYDKHSSSILNYCSFDRFSLRHPKALASPFASGKLSEHSIIEKTGEAHPEDSSDESPDISRMLTFFSYDRRYTLLSKFISSREFIRLESRFLKFRSVDITKCFYNIYTHSITWAVKDKYFAKEKKGAYSFEAEFDTLMQKSNFNETNGIVVGPETSRIFAEIILQAIDKSLLDQLNQQGLKVGTDYDIRRYVDDYFVFANNDLKLDQIEKTLRDILSEYKLYPNDSKINTYSRPFVSSISLARFEINEHIRAIFKTLHDDLSGKSKYTIVGHVRSELQALRLVVRRNNIEFANVSGWLMARFKKIIQLCHHKATELEEHRQFFLDISILILESALYICSVDVRVRTAYSICQIALLLRKNREPYSSEQRDAIDHLLMEECGRILRSGLSRFDRSPSNHDCVEVYNLLICGAEFVGKDFVESEQVSNTLKQLLDENKITYFLFITLKFCFLKSPSFFADEMNFLNDEVEQIIISHKGKISQSSEAFMMLSDFLASPDIERNRKRQLFDTVLGGVISNALIDQLSEIVGFADWTALQVEHQLHRKELRPVYAWG